MRSECEWGRGQRHKSGLAGGTRNHRDRGLRTPRRPPLSPAARQARRKVPTPPSPAARLRLERSAAVGRGLRRATGQWAPASGFSRGVSPAGGSDHRGRSSEVARARARTSHVGRAPIIKCGGGGCHPSDGCRRASPLSSPPFLRRCAASRRSQPRSSRARRLDLPVCVRPCLRGEWGAAVKGAVSPGRRDSCLVSPPSRPRPFWRSGAACLRCPGRVGGRARGGALHVLAAHPARGCGQGAMGVRHRGPLSPQDEPLSPRVLAMASRAAPLAPRSPRRPGPPKPARRV